MPILARQVRDLNMSYRRLTTIDIINDISDEIIHSAKNDRDYVVLNFNQYQINGINLKEICTTFINYGYILETLDEELITESSDFGKINQQYKKCIIIRW